MTSIYRLDKNFGGKGFGVVISGRFIWNSHYCRGLYFQILPTRAQKPHYWRCWEVVGGEIQMSSGSSHLSH